MYLTGWDGMAARCMQRAGRAKERCLRRGRACVHAAARASSPLAGTPFCSHLSVLTSCAIRPCGNSGARSSAVIGCSVLGCSGGGGGDGRSACVPATRARMRQCGSAPAAQNFTAAWRKAPGKHQHRTCHDVVPACWHLVLIQQHFGDIGAAVRHRACCEGQGWWRCIRQDAPAVEPPLLGAAKASCSTEIAADHCHQSRQASGGLTPQLQPYQHLRGNSVTSATECNRWLAIHRELSQRRLLSRTSAARCRETFDSGLRLSRNGCELSSSTLRRCGCQPAD